MVEARKSNPAPKKGNDAIFDMIERKLGDNEWLGGAKASELDANRFKNLKDQKPSHETHPQTFAWFARMQAMTVAQIQSLAKGGNSSFDIGDLVRKSVSYKTSKLRESMPAGSDKQEDRRVAQYSSFHEEQNNAGSAGKSPDYGKLLDEKQEQEQTFANLFEERKERVPSEEQ